MHSQLTPSELIDVFLDGEHSGIERTLLFSALGTNTDLQHEFEDALRIRTAALRDAATTLPPPDLTRAVMVGAGFGTASGIISSEVASSAAASLLARLTAVFAPVLHAAKIPLATAIVGFALGSYTSTFSSMTPLSPDGESRLGSSTERIGSSFSGATSSAGLATPSFTPSSYDSSPTASSASRSIRDSNREPAKRSSFASYADIDAHDNADPTNEAIVNTESKETNLNHQKAIDEAGRQGMELSPATIATRSVISSVTYNVPAFERPNVQQAAVEYAPSPLSLSIRGTRGLRQTLDPLVSRADALNMGNLTVGLSYRLQPEVQILLESGRESFATYVYDNVAGNLSSRVQQNIVWIAAGVRGHYAIFGSENGTAVFGQVLVGASDVGALVRPMAGLQWQPDSRVTLFGGVEQVVLQTRAQGTTSYGSKMSLTYGLNLRF